MQWYREAIDRLNENKIYCHKELIKELKTARNGLSESSYLWAVNELIRKGVINKIGYDTYSLSTDDPKSQYFPTYSDASKDLIKLLTEEFPYVKFTIFETALLNEFLNHLIAQNTIFLQVEKESSINIFRFLQERGNKNILYKPQKEELDLYWSRNCIIVTDMISQAPLRREHTYSILLEKLLVDIISDKLIISTFSEAELFNVMKYVKAHYLLDKVRMMRYARRRNRGDVILKYFEGE